MRKRFNKLVAAFLVVVLSVAFVPLAAIAIDGADQEDPITEPAVVQADNNDTVVSGTTDTPADTEKPATTETENTPDGTPTEGEGGTIQQRDNISENPNSSDGNEGSIGTLDPNPNQPVVPPVVEDTEGISINAHFMYLDANEIPANASLACEFTYGNQANPVSLIQGTIIPSEMEGTASDKAVSYSWSLTDEDISSMDGIQSIRWNITQTNLDVDGYVVGFGASYDEAFENASSGFGTKQSIIKQLSPETHSINVYIVYLIPSYTIKYKPYNFLSADGTLHPDAPDNYAGDTKPAVVDTPVIPGTEVDPLKRNLSIVIDDIRFDAYNGFNGIDFEITKNNTDFELPYVKTVTLKWYDGYSVASLESKSVVNSKNANGKLSIDSKEFPAAPVREGYDFMGWSEPVVDASSAIITALWKVHVEGEPTPTPPPTPSYEVEIPNVIFTNMPAPRVATPEEEVVADEATPMAAPVENATPQQIADDETPKAAPVYTVPSIEYTIMLLGFLLIAAFGVAAVVRRIRDEHTKSAFERHLLG